MQFKRVFVLCFIYRHGTYSFPKFWPGKTMSAQSINDLLFEAATLLMVGMGFVFVFLTILIAAVNLLKAFCERFPGQEPQAPTRASSKAARPAQANEDKNMCD